MSATETSPSMLPRTRSTIASTSFGSTAGASFLAAVLLDAPGLRATARLDIRRLLERAEDRGELRLQRRGIERLDDVVADPRLARHHHVLGLALGRHHDEGEVLELDVGAHLAQELQAGHRLHVPVGNNQPVRLVAKLLQGEAAVRRLVDVVEAELLQKIADDPKHGLVVIDDEDRHVLVDGHRNLSLVSTAPSRSKKARSP